MKLTPKPGRAVELHGESRCREIEAFLADRIYEFNVKATGYADGRLLAGTIQDDTGRNHCRHQWSHLGRLLRNH